MSDKNEKMLAELREWLEEHRVGDAGFDCVQAIDVARIIDRAHEDDDWEYGVGDDANYVWFGPSSQEVARERMRALVGPAALMRRRPAGEWEVAP